MATLNYIELPVGSAAESMQFYSSAFGWQFTGYEIGRAHV